MVHNFDLGLDDQTEFVHRSRQFAVDNLLRKSARMDGDVVAVDAPSATYTYRELDARTDAVARGLEKRFDSDDVTAALLTENRAEAVEVLFGCAKLGMLVAALNWRLEREELVHCVDLADPDILFVSERYADRREWVKEDAKSDPTVVSFDAQNGVASYKGLVDAGREGSQPDRDVDPESGFAVIYTSGTTGLPKGAVVSHRAEFARTHQVVRDMRLETGDSYISWAPMFHMSTVDWVVTTASLRGTYHVVDGFDPERIVEILRNSDRPIAWLFLVPGVLETFIDYVESNGVDTSEFAEVRCTGSLADLSPPEQIQRVTELLDAPFHNSYGSTEVGWAAAGRLLPVGQKPTEEDISKVESPMIDVKLVDEEWNEAETEGEIAVRGPSLASGYVNNPDANATEFEDGWFRTGDLFTRNDDGTYSYETRRKYLIKSGGENIYPGEIERPLIEHDEIADAVAVRVPDDKWGEVPKVYVSVAAESSISSTDVLEFLRGRIANYKLPHYVEIVDKGAFPRGTTGKIIREEVEEWPVSEDEQVRSV